MQVKCRSHKMLYCIFIAPYYAWAQIIYLLKLPRGQSDEVSRVFHTHKSSFSTFLGGGLSPTALGMHRSTYAVRTDCIMLCIICVLCVIHISIFRCIYAYCVTLVRVSCTCNYLWLACHTECEERGSVSLVKVQDYSWCDLVVWWSSDIKTRVVTDKDKNHPSY